MEKSARIGKTLTWMVGFLIIVFTLVILVIASVLLSGSKRVSDGWDSIEFQEYGLKDLEKQNDIIYILNSEVDFNGEDIKFFNAITFSLDELSEIKNNEDKSVIEVFNLEKINSLFELQLLLAQLVIHLILFLLIERIFLVPLQTYSKLL